MGLWQLPLLCLAFFGTRNVRQRINYSIFARSDFLGFCARLQLLRSSSRSTCQSFRGPNRHSRGWRRSDGMRKGGSRLEVAFWCGSGHSRGIMPSGMWCTRARSHRKTCCATFQPHFVLFFPFSPSGPHFAPSYSFAHILLSGTPIDDPFSPTRSTSKHLPILTIIFSFKR